ncbi:class I SAM-dependent methyltransferase [Roseibium aestuarii]|uniref:Methyltransferase domain-containing protein n=1 Tax=Roseibium aestuarii TaxID=2600299 RepID=A0ABW4K0K6_9HYPH|nr:class I SAM-dependent methyltransferase [Roseibium aestuarii]
MSTLTAPSPTETIIDLLAPLWIETLGVPSAAPADDFFQSGGHSLKAMLFVSQLEKDHGICLPLSALVENPTLGGLADYIRSNPRLQHEAVEPFSIDGKETQIQYLLRYNDPDKQAMRNAAYESYYAQALRSKAHAEFCRQVYGENYGQHGMADFTQLDAMLDLLAPEAGDRLLDVGCGYGLISTYMAQKTGAQVVGIDLAASAIAEASERARLGDLPLEFHRMDLQQIDFEPESFDHIVSIDTIYFTRDQRQTIRDFHEALKPGGKLAIFRTFPKRSFTSDTWRPDLTELAVILREVFGDYRAVDFSAEENQHWASKLRVLDSLRDDFIAEGFEELFVFRHDEAAYEAGIQQFRYLFTAQKPFREA